MPESAGGGRVLREGSRLHRLRAAVRADAQRGLLRGAHQIERLAPAPLLASGGQEHGCALGSDGGSVVVRVGLGLSRPAAEAELLRCRIRQGLKFLTNNFTLPALTIAQIYKQRWQVELFFQ
jgi:IS4 transposase